MPLTELPSLSPFASRLTRRVFRRPHPGAPPGTIETDHEVVPVTLRRAIWPLREAMTTLVRDASLFFSDETRIYLRDCYDHTVQLLDLIDAWREIASSLMDLHISAVGQRTNEIMRVLTVISVLFMPMSFVAGLYGMNFDAQASPLNMPELRWAWGYPFALGLMAVSAAGFLLFFKRRGFLESVDGGFAKKRPR